MIRRKLTDRVDLLNAPVTTTSGYGGRKTRDWEHPTVTADVRALLQPLSSTEDTNLRDTTTTTWRLILDAGEPIDAYTHVRSADAGMLEVVGDPAPFKRRGRGHHIEALLQRISDGPAHE